MQTNTSAKTITATSPFTPITYSEVVDLRTETLDENTLVVDDGAYMWLADRETYDRTMQSPVARDLSNHPEAEAEYYSDFCNACPSLDRSDKERAKAAKALYLEIHGSEPNWA